MISHVQPAVPSVTTSKLFDDSNQSTSRTDIDKIRSKFRRKKLIEMKDSLYSEIENNSEKEPNELTSELSASEIDAVSITQNALVSYNDTCKIEGIPDLTSKATKQIELVADKKDQKQAHTFNFPPENAPESVLESWKELPKSSRGYINTTLQMYSETTPHISATETQPCNETQKTLIHELLDGLPNLPEYDQIESFYTGYINDIDAVLSTT